MEDRSSSPSTPPAKLLSSLSGNVSSGENSGATTTRTTPYDTQESSPAASFLKPASVLAAPDSEPEFVIADYGLEAELEENQKDDNNEEENEDNDDDDDEEEENEEDDDVNDGNAVGEKRAEVAATPTTTVAQTGAEIVYSTAATPSDAAYAGDATPADADYAAATPADVATLHLLLEDSSKSKHENMLVGRFISKGCSCMLGPKGQPCYTGFSIEDILKKRNAALALPKNERELIVKAYLLHMRREPEHNPGE